LKVYFEGLPAAYKVDLKDVLARFGKTSIARKRVVQQAYVLLQKMFL